MFDAISSYFGSLDGIQTFFTGMMIIGALLLLVQIILSMVGGGLDANADGIIPDIGTSDYSFRFISFFSFSAFLFVGGGCGIWIYSLVDSSIISSLVALVAGSIALVLVHYFMKFLLSMQSSGNVKLDSAKGQTALVYLTIPQTGKGQVEITIQGRKKILPAMVSPGCESIPTGSTVLVKDVSSSTLIVEAVVSDGKQS